MAIKLSVSVRTPIMLLRYACPYLYGSKLNCTTFDKPIVPIRLWTLKDMAIKLSVFVNSPSISIRYACPSLYGSKLNCTTFDKPSVPIRLWTLKDVAVKLLVSVRSPIKTLRCACPSLYWSRLNRTSFNKPYHNNKALNSNIHGYQVISLCKNTHQVSTICMSISLWI